MEKEETSFLSDFARKTSLSIHSLRIEPADKICHLACIDKADHLFHLGGKNNIWFDVEKVCF